MLVDKVVFAVIIIAVALIFDFLNGFHDAANAISTIVVAKTLTPRQAVLLAGFANLLGYFLFGVTVANTIGKGIIDVKFITLHLIFAALLGAIFWNILTWFLGLPTSSSHALIGGLVGSAVASVGFKAVILKGVLKIFLFIFIAPILGMTFGIIFTSLIIWLFKDSHPAKSTIWFRRIQLLSSTLNSVGHGTNDAQKTMGIIALVLLSAGMIPTFRVDNWVMLSCYTAISIGTVFGGWRIVKTMGTNITKIRPMEGFCAETSSAAVLLGTAHVGIPVSTTHVIAGAIMGVGSAKNASRVHWVTARRILWAWILTIPCTAAFAALSYYLLSIFVC